MPVSSGKRTSIILQALFVMLTPPPQPIFHEGSKGYLCCKRRVLDFDDFLNMPGCRYTTHLFVGQPKAETEDEEMVDCRLDHYQTPSQVIVSAFAKG